ncbi:hypothetical protein GIB67_002919 [Kingdonia uniflora]|uniref:S-acyltransferase n=1 Tax=Kingdonia uniflora TaxID=39325 RepID=A0A7J7N3B7_9MAGN|nr:hypothetical protein GIB67_002919 [Kingdonia uniflora]
MCFLSFVSSVVIDPGNVPSGFSPDIEEDGSETETSINGFNKKDHHCMWINNCVGFANYKPFVIFIMYAAICCIYSMVIIIMSTLQRDSEIGERRYVKILYVSCRSLTAFLSLIMGSLLVWHIYLLSHNMTTIEYKEGKRAKWLAKKSGQNYRHPFDLGVYKNIISVTLGPLFSILVVLKIDRENHL